MTREQWEARAPKRPPFAWVEDDPSLPRVLLLGDSISISYTLGVRRRLVGVANVHRAPDNCRTTRFTLAELQLFLGDGAWQVIHGNWGIHDITRVDTDGNRLDDPSAGVRQVGTDEYRDNLIRIFDRLDRTGATVIWATTTPVQPGTPMRLPEDVPLYNGIAESVLRPRGIGTDDLFALVAPRMTELQPPQNVHFTEAGAEVLAERVAACIRDAL